MVMYLSIKTSIKLSISFFFTSVYLTVRYFVWYERKHFIANTEPFRGSILHLNTRNKCDS